MNDPEEIGELFQKELTKLLGNGIHESAKQLADMAITASMKFGTGSYCTVSLTPKDGSPHRAFVTVVSGQVPDDLLESLANTVKATMQDFTLGNKGITLLSDTDDDD